LNYLVGQIAKCHSIILKHFFLKVIYTAEEIAQESKKITI
jgi:hypothetical protein